MASIAALSAAERQLTARLEAIEDPRCPLLESIPAIGPLAARVWVSALDEVQRFEDSKAVANDGALAPTIYQSGALRQVGRINRDGRGRSGASCCNVPIRWRA
jgi:transposase